MMAASKFTVIDPDGEAIGGSDILDGALRDFALENRAVIVDRTGKTVFVPA